MSKNKATGTPYRVYYIQPSLASSASLVGREGALYIYTNVGLSALLVSTYWAMREPLLRGTSIRAGSTFYYVYAKDKILTANFGVVGLHLSAMCKVTISFKEDFNQEEYMLINGIHASKTLWEQEQDTPLYRYMDAEYLLSLLDSKKLHINNRQKFEDLNEHGWKLNFKFSFPPIPQVRNKQEQKKMYKASHSKWVSAYSCCISCWTRPITDNKGYDSENYLMWKNYTSKYGVRIKTTCKDLVNCIYSTFNKDIILDKIEYSESEIRSFLAKDMIFSKRAFYKDEREIRLCVLDNSSYFLLKIDPETLIKGVTFSPFMPRDIRMVLQNHLENNYEWLRGKINSSLICTQNNLF